jgi:hypothetical protein
MTDLKNKRIHVRIRGADAENIRTLLTVAGPFRDLAGISDVVRLSLKVAADAVRREQPHS